jgi:uncharacterized protein with von Willebrand factor type A (vWA) domain
LVFPNFELSFEKLAKEAFKDLKKYLKLARNFEECKKLLKLVRSFKAHKKLSKLARSFQYQSNLSNLLKNTFQKLQFKIKCNTAYSPFPFSR